MSWQRISPEAAAQLIAEKKPTLVDVRDPHSFKAGRIPGAFLLDNQSVHEFTEDADKSLPVLVYCYHGNSSKGAADYFSSQGYKEVYSMDGGYEAWRLKY